MSTISLPVPSLSMYLIMRQFWNKKVSIFCSRDFFSRESQSRDDNVHSIEMLGQILSREDWTGDELKTFIVSQSSV